MTEDSDGVVGAPHNLEGHAGRDSRWPRLLDLVAHHGRLSVTEAAGALGVSTATIRRDFSVLAEQQLVTRTHGGVVATAVAYDLPARYRSGADQARERIAQRAAELVDAGQVVGFNGGRTTSAAARHLAVRQDLTGDAHEQVTVVTNTLNIAAELVLRPHIRTVTLGGVARAQSYELIGELALRTMDQLWLDVLIVGATGVDPRAGVTCLHEGEAAVSGRMVARANRTIVAVESRKLDSRAFGRICPLNAVHTLVTDTDATPEQVTMLREHGIEVVQV